MTEVNGGAANRWRTNGVQDFASSELFDRTFQEGMELVEETASYLDGAGLLERSARLYERVLHLDRRMYKEEPADEAAHPVLSQIEKLQAAFGPK
jgi:hypothetical protein